MHLISLPPLGGDRVTIWCNSVDYVGEFDKLNSMAADLTNQTDIIDKVDSWTLEFERYGSVYNLMDFDHQVLNKSVFNEVLTQFLFSPKVPFIYYVSTCRGEGQKIDIFAYFQYIKTCLFRGRGEGSPKTLQMCLRNI